MTSDRRIGGVNILYLSCALAGKNPKPRLTTKALCGGRGDHSNSGHLGSGSTLVHMMPSAPPLASLTFFFSEIPRALCCTVPYCPVYH